MLIIPLSISLVFSATKKQEEKYTWHNSTIVYFNLPFKRTLKFPSNKGKNIYPWGTGFRIIEPYSRISKTFSFEIEYSNIEADNTIGDDNLWVLTLKYGISYNQQPKERQKYSFTSSILANLGFINEKLFFTPEFLAGIMYFTNDYNRESCVLSMFYRPIKINIGRLSGYNNVRISPQFGVRVGYLFEGFWVKE